MKPHLAGNAEVLSALSAKREIFLSYELILLAVGVSDEEVTAPGIKFAAALNRDQDARRQNPVDYGRAIS